MRGTTRLPYRQSMPRATHSIALLSLLLICSALSATGPAAQQQAQRIQLKPGALAVLAASVSKADDGQRWEFADALLAVLIDTYDSELQASLASRPDSDKRRAKLRRWQRATRELMDHLVATRMALSEGGDAVIDVDPQGQVLLFVEQHTVAFSAPRPGSERMMEAEVIEQYCAANDCSVLDDAARDEAQSASRDRGSWALHDRQLPTFEIPSQLHCTYKDLSNRTRKQIACHEAAFEAKTLLDAVGEAAHSGFAFDWQVLNDGRVASGPDTLLRVNATGDYVRLSIPRLARTDSADWAELVRWLRHRIETGTGILRIAQAERLLYDD